MLNRLGCGTINVGFCFWCCIRPACYGGDVRSFWFSALRGFACIATPADKEQEPRHHRRRQEADVGRAEGERGHRQQSARLPHRGADEGTREHVPKGDDGNGTVDFRSNELSYLSLYLFNAIVVAYLRRWVLICFMFSSNCAADSENTAVRVRRCERYFGTGFKSKPTRQPCALLCYPRHPRMRFTQPYGAPCGRYGTVMWP